MKNKIMWIITAVSFLTAAAGVNFLPEQIPAHYDINGVIDRYGSRYEVFIYPVLILIFAAVLTFVSVRMEKSLMNISDEKEAEMKRNNKKVISVVGICLTGSEFIMQCTSLFSHLSSSGRLAFADEIDPFKLQMSMLTFAFGIVFIILGNIMPKTKRNGMIGLRTNSSMKDDQTWQKSNRFAGKAMMISGFASVISALVFKGLASVIIMLVILSAVVVISCVYAASVASFNN